MFFEILFLVVALAGTAVGGYLDLKTTEIPDIVPLSMAGLGLILHIFYGFYLGSFTGLFYGVGVAIFYLVVGYLLYYTGQWGEADVLMLGAVGFLMPMQLSFFNMADFGVFYSVVFLVNTFIVGGVYSLLYVFILVLKKSFVISNFISDLISNYVKVIAASFGITFVIVFVSFVLQYVFFGGIFFWNFLAYQFVFFLPLAFILVVFYRFAKILDNDVFKKKISTSKLVEGDVLAEDVVVGGEVFSGKLFIGLTSNQVKKIKDNVDFVVVKEGIRYCPTFFFAILFTWFFGNAVFVFFGFI